MNSSDDDTAQRSEKSMYAEKVIDTDRRDPLTGSLMESEKMKLVQLLERWEEPDRNSANLVSSNC